MPDSKPTVEIPKPPPWANELMESLAELRKEQRATRDEQRALRKDMCEHFDKLESRVDAVETKTNSVSPSKHDLATEAKLATEIIEREKADQLMRAQIATIKNGVDTITETGAKLINNPSLRLFAQALLMFATAWLAGHTK